jgi:hypothetical protein
MIALLYQTWSAAWSRPVRMHHYCSHNQEWSVACGSWRLCWHPENWVPRIQVLSQDKEQDVHPCAVTQVIVLNHTSLQRWALEPSCVPRPPDLTSLLSWAPVLPRGPWPWASPPCSVKLRRCHLFLSFGHRLPVEVGSDAATCPMTPGSASLRGELRRCYVFLNFGHHLLVEVDSSAVTWPWPRLLKRRASVLPRTHGPQRAVDHWNKERHSRLRHTGGIACVQSTVTYYWGACKTCEHATTIRFNSAA